MAKRCSLLIENPGETYEGRWPSFQVVWSVFDFLKDNCLFWYHVHFKRKLWANTNLMPHSNPANLNMIFPLLLKINNTSLILNDFVKLMENVKSTHIKREHSKLIPRITHKNTPLAPTNPHHPKIHDASSLPNSLYPFKPTWAREFIQTPLPPHPQNTHTLAYIPRLHKLPTSSRPFREMIHCSLWGSFLARDSEHAYGFLLAFVRWITDKVRFFRRSVVLIDWAMMLQWPRLRSKGDGWRQGYLVK